MRTALSLALLALLTACHAPVRAPAPEPEPAPVATTATLPERLPHSMKGYQLYGYVRDGETPFTLITGTNRLKSFDELDDPEPLLGDDGWVRVRVTGVDRAADLLRRVPAESGVFVASVRHVSVAQNTVPADVTSPDEAVLCDLNAIR